MKIKITVFVSSFLQKLGSTVAQLVFACCQQCPKKTFIEEIVKLEKTMDMTALAKSIFEFADNQRYTCLLALFDMMNIYQNETGKYPDRSMPMFNEIESTALYLIETAENNKLNMDTILNWTTEDGRTLILNASLYSESLASELLKKNIVVTTVDNLFQIPHFQVSKICFYSFLFEI